MVKLKIKNLRAGMTVAQDVKDLNGRVLLAADRRLTEKHLGILKKWGVDKVVVHETRTKAQAPVAEKRAASDELSLPPGIPPELISKSKKECSEWFRFNNLEHPAVKELYRLAVIYRIKTEGRIEDWDGL